MLCDPVFIVTPSQACPTKSLSAITESQQLTMSTKFCEAVPSNVLFSIVTPFIWASLIMLTPVPVKVLFSITTSVVGLEKSWLPMILSGPPSLAPSARRTLLSISKPSIVR